MPVGFQMVQGGLLPVTGWMAYLLTYGWLFGGLAIGITLCFGVWIAKQAKSAGKPWALVMPTRSKGRFYDVKIANERVELGKKIWHVNKAIPILVDHLFGSRPLYVLPEDFPVAAQFDEEKIEGQRKGYFAMSSETMKRFLENNALKDLAALKASGMDLAMIVIGAIMGVMMGFIIRGFVH